MVGSVDGLLQKCRDDHKTLYKEHEGRGPVRQESSSSWTRPDPFQIRAEEWRSEEDSFSISSASLLGSLGYAFRLRMLEPSGYFP